MTIWTDTREQKNKHIIDYFNKFGIAHVRKTVTVGDYFNPDNPSIAVERKRDLSELCGNLGQNKARFYREFDRAKTTGIKLILLCEHGGDIKQLSDIANWQNPRLNESPRAVTGRELMERLYRLKMVYGIEITFCNKSDTGKRIIELLGVDISVHKS